MAAAKSRATRPGPKRFAIRLAASAVPVGSPARVYLICGPDGPVAAVPGGNTGEEEIAAAGFSNCRVVWDMAAPWNTLRVALALLPRVAGVPRRVR